MILKNTKRTVEGRTSAGTPYRAVTDPKSGLTVYRDDERGPGFADERELHEATNEVLAARPEMRPQVMPTPYHDDRRPIGEDERGAFIAGAEFFPADRDED